ncbi:hypothetical protein FRC03_002092 [Tulasnella sp. 419]|nr:hypothetical protein FRC03_002092 [Tulasnella sp. 419]
MKPHCQEFADPYVEHDGLILVLDLILLKKGVYRHLIFNRGWPPRRVGHTHEYRELDHAKKGKWKTVAKSGLCLVFIDAFIRWMQRHSSEASPKLAGYSTDFNDFVNVFGACLIDAISFHIGVMAACISILPLVEGFQYWWYGMSKNTSSIRQQFRLSHVPLTLLYSSLTKFFLLFLLSIWDNTSAESTRSLNSRHAVYASLRDWAWRAFDDDLFDREWMLRNLLGGMSAGFGLRVVLDCHPIFTTIMIMVGWITKIFASWVVSGSGATIRGDDRWIIYSIP